VKVKNCFRKCRLQAIAIDENGIESHSEYVEVTILNPPETNLVWLDGESWNEFEPGKPFRVRDLILVGRAESELMSGAPVKKIEISALQAATMASERITHLFFGPSCFMRRRICHHVAHRHPRKH
jgi:hypothetical protein